MIIKNFKKLATNHEKKVALEILDAGIYAAMPHHTFKKIVRKDKLCIGNARISLAKYRKIFVIAFGKAADSMAKSISLIVNVDGGIIVLPMHSCSIFKNKKFKIFHAGHPIPNKYSVRAVKAILKFLKQRQCTDFIIFLVSGGGSSLVSIPEGITLNEKKIVTDLLLKSGADIHEINCIRKHLSKIKGGKMAEHLSCDAVSLVMSDVVGDDLSVIASGATYCDHSTFNDAKKTLEKYGLKKSIPQNVLQRIKLGMTGKVPETPKSPKMPNYTIASNKDCLHAMVKKAKSLGLKTKVVYPVTGDVKYAAKKLVKLILNDSKSCLIFGGETTVRVTGAGKGGRNQELVLHVLDEIQKLNKKITIASIGTDGKDGNTNACGAIVSSSESKLKDIRDFLQNNDSYYFFKKHGGLMFTGPTHTNLMDIGIILR